MRIGEVAQTTGVSARMLRHYESHGLLSDAKRLSSGYRDFDEEDLKRIFHIESLRSMGLSLKEVKGALDDPDFSTSNVLEQLIVASRHRLLEEKELYDRLSAIRKAGATDWNEAVGIIALLKGLRSADPSQRQTSALSISEHIDAKTIARSALEEDNLNVAGAFSWAALKEGKGVLQEVAKALDSPDHITRERAIRILVQAPDTDKDLLRALEDSKESIREIAAVELAKRGYQDALEELFRMIISGRHDVEAAEALAEHPEWESAVLERLSQIVHDPKTDSQTKARITQALAEFKGSTAVVKSLLNDADVQVRLTAKAILMSRG